MSRKITVETRHGSTKISDVKWISFEKRFFAVASNTTTSYFAYKEIINIVDTKEST